jgi:hypothetical protein
MENLDHCINAVKLDPTTVQIPKNDKIRKDVQTIPVRKGSLIIFDSRIPHGLLHVKTALTSSQVVFQMIVTNTAWFNISKWHPLQIKQSDLLSQTRNVFLQVSNLQNWEKNCMVSSHGNKIVI